MSRRAPSSCRHAWWVALAVVVSLSLVGCGRGGTVGASASTPSAWPNSSSAPNNRPASCPDPGPTTVVDGTPAGFCPDAAGARAAGVAFSRLNERLVGLDPDAAGVVWRAMAAEASAEALVADVVARLARLRETWPPGTLTYRVAPLAVRATTTTAEEVDVDVWYVGVVAGAGIPTYEEWVTDSYRLVWERHDWRVAAFSDAPGPRPAPGYQPADDPAGIEARLVGFEPVA